jgi:uncharacterized protein
MGDYMNLRALLLTATALAAFTSVARAGDLAFTAVPAPADDAAKRMVVVSPDVMMDGVKVPLAYHVMARSGDMIGGAMFGQITDKDGKALTDGDSAWSNAPDFTSLLKVGSKMYSLTHFETLPAAMYLSELAQGADGVLSMVSTKAVDFSAVGGLWNPCAGSVTPWGTHLGNIRRMRASTKRRRRWPISRMMKSCRWRGISGWIRQP